MQLNRRNFIKVLAAGGIAAVSTEAIYKVLTAAPAGALKPLPATERDPVTYAIARLTFGPTPDLIQHVRTIGAAAFLEEQLNPQDLDDSDMNRRLREFPYLRQDPGELMAAFADERRVLEAQFAGGTILRAMYSQRQLFERVVGFWSDHFNIYIGKGFVLPLKVVDDRDVIRRYALDNFRELLGASAHSPAMLYYLDNAQNERSAPNENYARELMELHTIGVTGGYTEDDVKEVARAFTGWTIVPPRANPRRPVAGEPATFSFTPERHDDGAKTVMGLNIPAGRGERDGELVLDLLASHPAAAQLISSKLAWRFVADSPPQSVVDAGAETFRQTGGDLRATLRTILTSPEFWNAAPKLKRPFEYTMSLLRALNYDVRVGERFARVVVGALAQMGHVPFTRVTPDGFPDASGYWANNLLPRWNAALTVTEGTINGADARPQQLINWLRANQVPLEGEPLLLFLGEYFFGRPLSEPERQIVMDFVVSVPGTPEEKVAAGIGLLLASPAFQYI